MADNRDKQTIYFKNGKMYKVCPNDEEGWYDARYLVSDGIKYDLENVNDIRRIPIPKFNQYDSMMEGYGVTGSLDYVVRMKAGNARQKGLIKESDELYKKAIALMQASGIYYDIKPYLYFAKDLLRDGRFEESEIWERKAHKIYNNQQKKFSGSYETLAQKNFYHDLEFCKRFNIDYVEITYLAGTCEKCALYHGRVYCLSGKDKRFPKFPKFIKNQGFIHDGCRHSIRPFDYPLYNTVFFRDKDYDAIEISNRPFIDDRTEAEKSNYKEFLKKVELQNKPFITQNEREYYRIKYMLPEITPKSLSGYTKMKNTKSANFLKIVEKAKEKGIEIKE